MDHAKFAGAGGKGYTIKSASEVNRSHASVPTIVDVYVDPNAAPLR